MELILLERVEKLGQMGDIVTVKDGFARNFLLPQKKALRATANNKAMFETQRKELEAQNVKLKSEAEKLAASLSKVKVTLIRQAGDSGQLYGSVNTRDISNAVSDEGFKIDRNQVILSNPIKTLGLFNVSIRLHPEVSENVVVNVARSDEEAKTQFETGAALVGNQDDGEIEFVSTFDKEEDAIEALETVVEEIAEVTATEETPADDEATEDAAPTAEVVADAPAEAEEKPAKKAAPKKAAAKKAPAKKAAAKKDKDA